MHGTKGELITIKVSIVIEWKVGCCFSGPGAGMCPNKKAGCRAFLDVTVGVAPLHFKSLFSVGLGLVRCEMAKDGMLSSRWVVSHTDGLTGSAVYVPRHILSSVCTSQCEDLAVCDSCVWLWVCVHWGGSVCRWRHSARHFYQLVNSYLRSPHKHNCTSVCKKESLCLGKWNSYKMGKIWGRAEACVCVHFSAGAWRAGCQPRWHMVGTQVMRQSSAQAFLCVHMCGCMAVCLFHSDDHLCPALQSNPFCPAPQTNELLNCFFRWHPDHLLPPLWRGRHRLEETITQRLHSYPPTWSLAVAGPFPFSHKLIFDILL